jgi:hypothetical protein
MINLLHLGDDLICHSKLFKIRQHKLGLHVIIIDFMHVIKQFYDMQIHIPNK